MESVNADFDYEVLDDVIVIYDLDQGGKSVTHDIHQVLRSIRAALGGDFGPRKIIYRDSMKVFDGISVSSNGDFIRFYPIQERVLEAALNKIRNILVPLRDAIYKRDAESVQPHRNVAPTLFIFGDPE